MSRPSTIKSILLRVKNETVVNPNDCWIWAGALSGRGYPSISWKGTTYILPRLMHKWCIGPIAKDADVHHKCEEPKCVNPAHLEATNSHKYLHRVTHCRRGHEYTAENTAYSGHGHRYCKSCQRIMIKIWRRKQKMGGEKSD